MRQNKSDDSLLTYIHTQKKSGTDFLTEAVKYMEEYQQDYFRHFLIWLLQWVPPLQQLVFILMDNILSWQGNTLQAPLCSIIH